MTVGCSPCISKHSLCLGAKNICSYEKMSREGFFVIATPNNSKNKSRNKLRTLRKSLTQKKFSAATKEICNHVVTDGNERITSKSARTKSSFGSRCTNKSSLAALSLDVHSDTLQSFTKERRWKQAVTLRHQTSVRKESPCPGRLDITSIWPPLVLHLQRRNLLQIPPHPPHLPQHYQTPGSLPMTAQSFLPHTGLWRTRPALAHEFPFGGSNPRLAPATSPTHLCLSVHSLAFLDKSTIIFPISVPWTNNRLTIVFRTNLWLDLCGRVKANIVHAFCASSSGIHCVFSLTPVCYPHYDLNFSVGPTLFCHLAEQDGRWAKKVLYSRRD